jgi:hypothetical protein
VLARFALAQDFRTIKSWMGFRTTAERVLRGVIETVKRGIDSGQYTLPEEGFVVDLAEGTATVRRTDLHDGRVEVGIEAQFGVSHWTLQAQRMVDQYAPDVARLPWRILRPAPGFEWPTSDHPVLRLGFSSEKDVRFDGGWLQPGVDLLFPLSPEHLMHAQVGRSLPPGNQLSQLGTFLIQKYLAMNSSRAVFMRTPSKRIGWFVPHHVDRDLYQAEDRVRRGNE